MDERSSATSTAPQLFARVRQEHVRHLPNLQPGTWYLVVEEHPEATSPLPGWCWLDVQGRLSYTPMHQLVFSSKEPSP